MPTPGRPDVDALLAHAGWIAKLASSLVADPNQAEDLVQKTWVAALEHPPGAGKPLKGWLAVVLRNFAREERRTKLQRAAREERSARAEALPSAHDAVAFAHLQRDLIEAVLALEEPYRDAIVWRYFEGLPPRRIAERLGVPVNTVKTRLARGIEKLRAELDRRNGGDREAWLSALIPLAVRPEIPASALWSLLVNTNLKLALAATIVVGALFGVWTLARPNAPVQAPPPAVASAPEAPAPTLAAGPEIVAPAREMPSEREVAVPPAAAPEPPATPPILSHGRVVDADGRAVAGIELVSGPREQIATLKPIGTSAADGTFSAPGAELRGSIFGRAPQYTTVFCVEASPNAPMTGLVVVVAPKVLLAGVVVDGEGRGVGGAHVRVQPEREFLRELGLITDQSFEVRTATTTDATGRFEIPDAPGMPHAAVEVVATGYEPSRHPAPRTSTHELRLVLMKSARPVLRGEVVDARDRPVPRAWIAAGGNSTRADADGRFEFEPGEDAAWGLALLVAKQGFLPARIEKPDTGWPAEITVRLDGAPLSIRGRVVDAEDRPVEGAEIWTLDEERFARLPGKDSHAEFERTIESLIRRGPAVATSDARGDFELEGLQPKDYRLAASEKSTLRTAATEPLRAGSDRVTIRLPSRDRCVRVAGRVVSSSRSPVAGVLVFPKRVLVEGDGSQFPPPSADGESRLTDAEGRFAFEEMLGDDLYFQVSGPNLEIVWKWDPPVGARLDELEIVVALRCHVQVDLGDRPGLADEFEVLTGAGEQLDLVLWEGPRASIRQSRTIQDGRSDILSVSDAGRTLVLRRAGEEIQRLPVALVPGEVTVVRP